MMNRFAIFGSVILLFTLGGCGGGGSSNDVVDPELFFVNASADAGLLDFKMNDEIAEDDLAYKGTSTEFTEFEFIGEDEDGYDLSLHDGTTDFEIFRQAVVFPEDTDTVVVAYGIRNFAAGDDLKRLRMAAFTTNRQAVNGNRTRLIVFHGIERSAGKTTPSIIFKNPGSNPQFETGPIDVGKIEVMEVDSGTQSWEVKRSDTEGIFATSTNLLEAGAVYVVLLAGIEDDPIVGNQPSITFIKLETTS